jgi:hypothetical protein
MIFFMMRRLFSERQTLLTDVPSPAIETRTSLHWGCPLVFFTAWPPFPKNFQERQRASVVSFYSNYTLKSGAGRAVSPPLLGAAAAGKPEGDGGGRVQREGFARSDEARRVLRFARLQEHGPSQGAFLLRQVSLHFLVFLCVSFSSRCFFLAAITFLLPRAPLIPPFRRRRGLCVVLCMTMHEQKGEKGRFFDRRETQWHCRCF